MHNETDIVRGKGTIEQHKNVIIMIHFLSGLLKLNLEPKKSGSSPNSGNSTSRSAKSEGSSAVWFVDAGCDTTTEANQQTSRPTDTSQPNTSTPRRDSGPREKDRSGGSTVSPELESSPAAHQNHTSTDGGTVAPRLDNSKIREDTLQPKSSVEVVNGNPQPLR